ncbi:sugar ABC transporter permease [Paenibacillus sp. 1_12]|uniref:ABC transporter permease n=1 Tax=Paenibacillus sp. 1_12 TaxID=1566278 RepID=UPI000B886B96|nr:ABC transporter permease subunit [Paenibacillus sp. 1_12]
MFIPVILYYIIFKYVPMFGLVIAFKNYNFHDGFWGSTWVGFKHFQTIFHSSQTISVIKNTLVLSVLQVFVSFPFPIVIAILLNEVRKSWFKRSVQTMLYIPHFLSWIIVGGMITTMFSMQTGAINHVITYLFGEPFPFLYRENSWIAVFVGSGIWRDAGYSAIIYIAALTAIDSSLYEAASMDGANKWRQVWHITLPGIRPTIFILLILSMGRILEVGFDHVYIMQNSTVSAVSEVISTYIYKVGLQSGQFSLTAALGLFESVVGLILVLSANSVAKRFKQNLW